MNLSDWPLDAIHTIAAARGVQVWPVGGVVRDLFLERETHDWDFVVDRDALRLARAVADALGGAYFPLDAERDTGRVVLERAGGAPVVLDFAVLRGPHLEADLRARDFTVNAMALEPDGTLVDPNGGYADLRARLLRAVGPQAFDDDPLRMLRAVRQVAELGLRLEAKTAAWIVQRASTLTRPSAERVRDEFARILLAPAAADHVHMLDELGLLVHVIPEMEDLKGQAQSPPHRFDVWWHTLMVVEGVAAVVGALDGAVLPPAYVDAPERVWDEVRRVVGRFAQPVARYVEVSLTGGRPLRALLMLAALCHDVGKPLTCTEDERGRLHFYNHDHAGAEMTAERMRALRFGRAEVDWVERVVQAHLRPAHLACAKGAVTRRAVYRFFRATGDAGVGVVLLSLADHLATWGPHLEPVRWQRRLEVADVLLSHYFEHFEETVAPPSLISGRDVMAALDVPAGPALGRLLERVREAQAAGEVTSREEALDMARACLNKGAPEGSSS
ncbi:MAG: HD domain-containing protein [Anaerolineae bacterium]|nr:HD domain-containing protein [Anaerolineae bacterium]